MAEPISTVLLAKAAATAASDKRVQKIILGLIAGIVFCFCIPAILIVSYMNTAKDNNEEIARIVFLNGEIPIELSDEYKKYIREMQTAFAKLDIEMELINEYLNEETMDDTKVKSFFYALYFGSELDFEDEFFRNFVRCFVGETDTKQYEIVKEKEIIHNSIAALIGRLMTDTEKENADSIYFLIKYGYSGGNIGIVGEAFDDETFAALMAEATKYIGFPYVWGGSSPSTSFDCSGFVCWSYTQSGVYNLPRTTAQNIYNQCVSVALDEAKAGDLVFFTKTYESANPVTHVGIFVGNGQFLHCGDPIGYASLDNNYWRRHFYGVGRLM